MQNFCGKMFENEGDIKHIKVCKKKNLLTLTLLRGWWGRWEKSVRSAPAGPGLEPGTCRVLGEGPRCTPGGAV